MRLIKKALIMIFIFIASIIANISIKVIPFKKLMGRITNDEVFIEEPINMQVKTRLFFILQSIKRVEYIVPWRVKCFEQAIIFLVLAHLLKVDVNVYFGVKKEANGEISAHAWTKCGGYTWTGFDAEPEYTPVYSRSYRYN